MYPNTNSYDDPGLRNRKFLIRILVIGLIIILLVIGAVQLYNWLTSGQLIVNTDSKNARISVTRLTGGTVLASGQQQLNTRLKAGEYSVLVTVNSFKVSKVVDIQARHTQSVTLNPPKALAVEPVADATANNVVASDSVLYFLNSAGKLAQINSQDNLTTQNNSTALRNIVWANSGFGVGIDPNNNLYTITNGQEAKLNITVTTGSKGAPIYTVAPNGTIYVAEGKQIYAGNTAKLSHYYTASDTPTYLAASNNELVVVINPDENTSKTSADAKIIVLPNGGTPVSANMGSFFAVPSPDGKYIVASTSSGGEILDNKLDKVASLPSSNLMNPVWLNDNTLFYSDNSDLWSYSVTAMQAELRASAPLGGTITGLSLNDNSTYLYLTATLNNQPVIYRIGLNNQPVAPVLSKLVDIMPYANSDYFMTLINFNGQPTIVVSPQPPLTSTNQQYLQEAQSQLQSDGIDNSSLRFDLSLPGQ